MQICAGALPSSLATSASATTLDVSSNQLTALPLEWSNGFPNATQSLFNSIFLQQNRIQVCAFPVQTFHAACLSTHDIQVYPQTVTCLIGPAKFSYPIFLWRMQSPFPAALARMPRLLMFEASNNYLR